MISQRSTSVPTTLTAVLVILSASLAGPAFSAGKTEKAGRAARTTPLPTAVQALSRSIKAHEGLGSVAIRITLEELKDGKPISTRFQTVQRNDPEHYVTEFTEGDVRVRLIARGDTLVLHNVTRNAYRHGRNYRVDLAMPFSRIRDEVEKGLKDPRVSAALERARVSRSTISGAPVIRLVWAEPVRLGSLPMKALSIGERDGLMRQILLQDSTAAMRATAQYTPRRTPYPAVTFDFTPPSGARDLAAPDPETESHGTPGEAR